MGIFQGKNVFDPGWKYIIKSSTIKQQNAMY